MQSCRDEYELDNPGNTPPWLGESIYEELQNRKNFPEESFSLFLRVIDDLDYKEVLSKTGSKTLFVANDEAFIEGINKAWGITSYDSLNPGHKRIILRSAMLDNAYLLEMMSSTAASGDQTEPNENLCLRQVTSSEVIDTIYMFGTNDIPPYNRYWDHMRDQISANGIRLATDLSDNMMVHFLSGYVTSKGFTDEDMQYLVNRKDATTSDAYIFDKKVIKKDVTCKNGYIHQLDGLLIPPGNMAEEIRKYEHTTLFSRMLERFAVPVYNEEFTKKWNAEYHPNDDANSELVYEKCYFNTGARKSLAEFRNPDMDSTIHADGALEFSPGWNAYQPGLSPELNMGAIFAPTNDSLLAYFETGAGKSLIQRFGKGAPNTIAGIDSIPDNILEKLMRVMMRVSFNETVPSKFGTLKNDAQDDMGVEPNHLDERQPCIIANNGVVYITNKVYSPADYVAVSAPILLQENLLITERAVDWQQYYAFYKSMKSTFSVVVCADESMVYYDPCSSTTTTPLEGAAVANNYAYKLKWDPSGTQSWQENGKTKSVKGQIKVHRHTYDPNNPYVLSETSTETSTNRENIVQQILDYCTIVGDFTDGNKYYMSKGYGTVKVNNVNGEITEIWGGRELEDQLAGKRNGGIPVGETFHQENGKTYRLDEGLIHPATRSVYNILKSTPEFKEFYNLCDVPGAVIDLFDRLKDKNSTTTNDSYYIFHIPKETSGLDKNVRSFNTYHYTVYAPSNAAIIEAYKRGLPTWEELVQDVDVVKEYDSEVDKLYSLIDTLNIQLSAEGISEEETARLRDEIAQKNLEIERVEDKTLELIKEMKAKTNLIVGFVKYHFQDNSVYVDNLDHAIVEGMTVKKVVEYETAAMNDSTKLFTKLTVQTEQEGEYKGSLRVEGDIYRNNDKSQPLNVCHVVNTERENEIYNIMARDIERNTAGGVSTSSYAVVHLIDNYLVNDYIYTVDEDGNEHFKINK